jgi:hypothetical protein
MINMLNLSGQTELGFVAVQTAALPEFIWAVADWRIIDRGAEKIP